MNLASSTPNLQDLEQIVATLFSAGKCACHIINPHKTRILMWKLKDNTYHLRIGIQKFTSQEQTDRNGETYWRYWSSEKKEEENKEDNQTQKAQEYAKSDNVEPAVNSATS